MRPKPADLQTRPVSSRPTAYSVGVLGYEALTGRSPFKHENMGALARAILAEQPAPIPALRPDVELALVAVSDRAMACDPLRRFLSARQMRAALSDNVQRALAAGPLAAAAVWPATMMLTSPPRSATLAPDAACRTVAAEPKDDVDRCRRRARPDDPRGHPDNGGHTTADTAARDDKHVGTRTHHLTANHAGRRR
jgi:hypothetical protein